ncbi:MAG TPA: transcriptional regulator [Pyrinomonadaceae bacterium]|nr:transcriptional regulator [Pyrinomonadaceae bacterium]
MLAKQNQVSRLYEFGPFVLNPDEYLLVTNGTPISLPPRAFDLLLVLVENQGSLVTKDNLLKVVWQDVSVEEGNIPYNVSLVRKALGDNAAAPRYVATVSKLGYRFISPVKEVTESPTDSAATKIEIENNVSYSQPSTLDPTSRLLSSPLRNHVWHLLAACVLYALYYSVAFMLEVAYEYETYGIRALRITPLIFLWVMGTSLIGLVGGLRRTSRGSASGSLFSLSVFIGAGLTLYLVSGLFLPNHAITKALFQTYPAQGAFLKSVYYVLPLVVLFVVLPFHLIVAKESELLNGTWRAGLEGHRYASPGGVYLKTWWLAGILLGTFCVALLGTAHLFENLRSNPNSGLFIQLAQWRFLLYFLLGLECILWYQKAQ